VAGRKTGHFLFGVRIDGPEIDQRSPLPAKQAISIHGPSRGFTNAGFPPCSRGVVIALPYRNDSAWIFPSSFALEQSQSIETDPTKQRRKTMTTLKTTILAAVAVLALAGPSLAQNFQGFGASASATAQQDNAPTQSKAVKLKTNR
jgi:hypothetical protein